MVQRTARTNRWGAYPLHTPHSFLCLFPFLLCSTFRPQIPAMTLTAAALFGCLPPNQTDKFYSWHHQLRQHHQRPAASRLALITTMTSSVYLAKRSRSVATSVRPALVVCLPSFAAQAPTLRPAGHQPWPLAAYYETARPPVIRTNDVLQ